MVYRLGYDFYNERNVSGTNRGAPRGPVLGIYETFDNNNLIMDHNFLLNGNYTLSETIGMTFNVGATSRMEKYDRQGVSSTDQGIFDIFRHFNFSNQSPIQYTEERNIIGIYGQADFDYKKFRISVLFTNVFIVLIIIHPICLWFNQSYQKHLYKI